MATTIEAKAVISAEDKTGGTFDAIAKKMKRIGEAARVSAEVDRLGRSLGETSSKLTLLDRATRAQTAFDEKKVKFQQAAAALRDLARATVEVEKPTRDMLRAQREAERAFDRTRTAFQKQREAVNEMAGSLGKAGLSTAGIVQQQNRLRTAVDATSAALTRQLAIEARKERRSQALGTIGGAAGVIAAHEGRKLAGDAISSVAQFDIGTRYQRMAGGISEADQNRLLIPQAKRIGQDTQFTNLDIVEAQTAVMQRLPSQLPKAQVAFGIIGEVQNYAQAMRADMKASAEAITSFLSSTGKDISTQDKAFAAARSASNMLIRMGKIGGMNDDDLQQFMKYGAATSSIAGMSDETRGAIGVALRRAGFRGDEGGVALRALSSKLVAPTQKGMGALAAMGIDYSQYTRMPEGMSATGLGVKVRQDFGKNLSKGQLARIQAVIADGTYQDKDGNDAPIVSDRGQFTAAVGSIIAESFPTQTKGKNKGKLSAVDSAAIAKKVGEFHKLSVESVDVEGLLRAIFSSPRALGQLNALLTDKHGGKFGMLGKNAEQFERDRKELGTVPADYGQKFAAEIMGGVGGSFERLKGSVETFTLSVGEANKALLGFSFDKIGNAIDAISNLPAPALQAATALTAVGATYAGVRGGMTLIGALLGNGGLGGSAAALTTSAGLLDAAAIKLAGGSLAGAASTAAGVAGAARGSALARLTSLPMLGAAGLGVGVIAGSIYALDKIGPKNRGGGRGYQPMPEPDTGLGPASWAGTDVSGGLGGSFGPYASMRERTWMETLFGGPRRNSGRTDNGWRTDGTLPLPSSWMPGGGGSRSMPDLSSLTAKVVDPVPVKVEGSVLPMMITIKVDGNGQVVGGDTRNVPVTVRGASTGTSMPGARPQGFAPTMSGV